MTDPAAPLPAPFAEFADLLTTLPGGDAEAARKVASARVGHFGPIGALGRLETLPVFLARWQYTETPRLDSPMICLYAGRNGVSVRGISARDPGETEQQVEAFGEGRTPVAQICADNEINVRLFELAVELPTGDITETEAMDERTCAATIAYGMEAVAGDPDLLGIGEMGIGNTTIAAALFAALYGGTGADWVGYGSGVDSDGLARKADIVDRALARHAGELDHPLKILSRLGSREIAGMLGALIAARHAEVPVIIDGMTATAAAAIAHAVNPAAIDHCLFAQLSPEPGHEKALAELKQNPLLHLGVKSGEGIGAALVTIMARTALALDPERLAPGPGLN